jgi:hypothetical protein
MLTAQISAAHDSIGVQFFRQAIMFVWYPTIFKKSRELEPCHSHCPAWCPETVE